MFENGMISEPLVLKTGISSYYIGKLKYNELTATWNAVPEDKVSPVLYECYSDAYSALLLSYQQIVHRIGVV